MPNKISKLLTFLFLLTIMLLLLRSTSNVKASGILFEDDFNNTSNGAIPEKWQSTNSGWVAQEGRYGVANSGTVSNSFPKNLYWDFSKKNIKYEVDLEQTQGQDKNVLIKYVDNTNFIEVHTNNGGTYLEKYVSGSSSAYFSHYSPTFLNSGIHHYKILINNLNITVYIDDNLIFNNINDNGPAFDYWKIGLRTGAGVTVWYDNVLVTELETPTPTIGPFDLPFDYTGRGAGTDSANFKSAFWGRLTAAFDHTITEGIFRPFTGNTYSPTDCPAGILGIACYDSHNGIDFSTVGGTNVYSVTDGTVAYASDHTDKKCSPERSGFGCVVIISHPQNIFTLYAHLSKLNVNANDTVTSNTNIGTMGSTGCDGCGDHLHLGTLIPVSPTNSISLKLKKSDWQTLLSNIKSDSKTTKYKPFCKYLAPNGQAFSFIDPTGWKGSDTDPWSNTTKNGGCGVPTQYFWKYEIGSSL
jgi:murein DD-endopeptidase MepM/ murein hydrolase activator NlpD